MYDILLTCLISFLIITTIKKKHLHFQTLQSRIAVWLTIPIISGLYSSLLIDAITTHFSGIRYIFFVITIAGCLILLLFVYPTLLLRLFGLAESSIIGVIIHFVLLYSLSGLIPTNQSLFSFFGLMGKVAVSGIFFSSIFSGMSAVSIPMQHLDPFHKKYTEEEMNVLFAQLKFMECRNETRTESYHQLRKQYVIMSKSVKASKKRKGVLGIYNKLYGGLMTIYCLYRVINCILHLCGLKRVDGTSWISKFLSLLTQFVHLSIDWNAIGHFLSFFMIGILVIIGVKGLVSKTLKILQSFELFESRKMKGAVIVVVCYFITIYSLSFVIMSRSHLVASPESVIYTAFEGVDYNTYTWISDLFFFIIACISFVYYFLKNKYGFFISTANKFPD